MITKINLADKTIKSYAIRKLTPRECFRLMGVPESTIDVMQTTEKKKVNVMDADGNKTPTEVDMPIISASQQYRQAGNSIVVDCLTAIMENIFYPATEEMQVFKCDDGIHADLTIVREDDGQLSFF